MKSTGIIMQGFSIEGLCRQFFYQNAVKRVASNTVDKDFDITTMIDRVYFNGIHGLEV